MKSKNLKIIDKFIFFSLLFWHGVIEMFGAIVALFAGGFNFVALGLVLYFALDIVTAVCGTTKNRFSRKSIKINTIATSIRIALSALFFVMALFAGEFAFLAVIIIPIINAIYLGFINKVKKITLVSDDEINIQEPEKQNNSEEINDSQEAEKPDRYSLVKDVAKVFASWKNSDGEEYHLYVMPSERYDGVFVVEVSVKDKYANLFLSKNYIGCYGLNFFVNDLYKTIRRIDWNFNYHIEELAQEIWAYLKNMAESFDGEVSPEYKEDFYEELEIDRDFKESTGEAKLYYLAVGHILDKPAVYWKISWNSTGYHTDFASDTVIIDDETAKNLTVESLIEWMKKNLSNIFDLCTPNKYLEDEKLRAWCKWWSDYANKKAEQDSNKKTVAISIDSKELGADVVEKINQHRENKSDDTYNTLMSVIKKSLFMCPFLYEEEEFGKPVSDNAIHFSNDTKKSVESVIDSVSFSSFINDKEIDGNFSFNPTIITTDGRKLHINNAESYIFSKEASTQKMHYLTVANNGKQFIPLFTDIQILKKIYGNTARICIVDFATALEAAKMEIIDYNGNKANIDAIIVNPSRESFVLEVNNEKNN